MEQDADTWTTAPYTEWALSVEDVPSNPPKRVREGREECWERRLSNIFIGVIEAYNAQQEADQARGSS